MEIQVQKLERGIRIISGYTGAKGRAIEHFPSRFRVDLLGKGAVRFGTSETPSDQERPTG
jgi:hypothetical protein